MQIQVEEFYTRFTKTYLELRARHAKEQRLLLGKIKQHRKQFSLKTNTNSISPTPRTHFVCITRDRLDNATTLLDREQTEMNNLSPLLELNLCASLGQGWISKIWTYSR